MDTFFADTTFSLYKCEQSHQVIFVLELSCMMGLTSRFGAGVHSGALDVAVTYLLFFSTAPL